MFGNIVLSYFFMKIPYTKKYIFKKIESKIIIDYDPFQSSQNNKFLRLTIKCTSTYTFPAIPFIYSDTATRYNTADGDVITF